MLQNLRAVQFRCFEQVHLPLAERGAVLIGANAQGKTSLLEAACLLLRLQSPRTRRLAELRQHGQSWFGLSGEEGGEKMVVRAEAGQLEATRNGQRVPTRQAYIAESGSVVWMGNQDLELVRGGSSGRRGYLDFLGGQYEGSYYEHWARYRRALRGRNAVLKIQGPTHPTALAYQELLVEHGQQLVRLRREMVERLAPEVQGLHATISQSGEEVEVRYAPQWSDGDLEAAFTEVQGREQKRGQTLVGPHLDELVLLLNGQLARDYASEGQQRTLAAALRLAHGRLLVQRRPERSLLYCLDDIFGELDPTRRRALLATLPRGAQLLLTTTSWDWHEGELAELPLWEVRGGRVFERS